LELALGQADDARGHLESARAALVAAGARLLAREADDLAAALDAPVRGEDADEPAAANVWRRDGEIWTLRYAGRAVRLKDAKGLADLALLLAAHGSEVAAVELYAALALSPPPLEGHLGEVLDARARTAYRQRLGELEDELADAEAMNDRGRADKARAERDFLAAELSAALGIGHRPRVAGDPRERARKAVSNRIRLTIDRIAAVHPRLGHHLRHSVRTGVFCAYRPEHPTAWRL